MAGIESIVFVGFNHRVAALDVATGDIVWEWQAPKDSGGYVTLLLTADRQLVASVDGYIYRLDPGTGEALWMNEMSGFGTGVTSMVALGALSVGDSVTAAVAAKKRAAAAAASAT